MTPQGQRTASQARDVGGRRKQAVGRLKNYVNGRWVDPRDHRYIDVENPSTGETIAQSPLSTQEETDQAIAPARGAWPAWAATPVARRCEMLFALAELIRKNEETLARGLVEEMGKSLAEGRAGVEGARG